MILFSGFIIEGSAIPMALNPLYLITRILMVVEWGDIDPYEQELEDYCEPYYLWLDYYQTEQVLNRATEGMSCSELNSTAYDYYQLYYNNTSDINDNLQRYDHTAWQPTEDPDPTIFCQEMITSSMVFNTIETMLDDTVDPDLMDNWITQLILSAVALRILTAIFLWVISIDGFSWIRKRLVGGLCFVCGRIQVFFLNVDLMSTL